MRIEIQFLDREWPDWFEADAIETSQHEIVITEPDYYSLPSQRPQPPKHYPLCNIRWWRKL